MSAQDPTADPAAARSVRRWHAVLAGALSAAVVRLVGAAERDDLALLWPWREELVEWLRDELLPHVQAEEESLYRAAARRPDGRLLVHGMVAGHRAMADLVVELEDADTAVAVACAARALAAMFDEHRSACDELVVPLLATAGEGLLAELVDGVAALVGAEDAGGSARSQACVDVAAATQA